MIRIVGHDRDSGDKEVTGVYSYWRDKRMKTDKITMHINTENAVSLKLIIDLFVTAQASYRDCGNKRQRARFIDVFIWLHGHIWHVRRRTSNNHAGDYEVV